MVHSGSVGVGDLDVVSDSARADLGCRIHARLPVPPQAPSRRFGGTAAGVCETSVERCRGSDLAAEKCLLVVCSAAHTLADDGPDVDPIGRWLLERSVPGAHQPVNKTGYARVAPYSGVRWENEQPIVRVQDKWSELVSINGIPIDQVLEFANKEYGEKARKRIAEDLVQVLSTMGHAPEWHVTLGLKTQDGEVEQLKIRMTEENRKLLRK